MKKIEADAFLLGEQMTIGYRTATRSGTNNTANARKALHDVPLIELLDLQRRLTNELLDRMQQAREPVNEERSEKPPSWLSDHSAAW